MPRLRNVITVCLLLLLIVCACQAAMAQQVGTKCHITCRCLQDDSVGNFVFVIPVDRTPDMAFDADQACSVYGYRICLDGCNSRKFSYTYQVTSP